MLIVHLGLLKGTFVDDEILRFKICQSKSTYSLAKALANYTS